MNTSEKPKRSIFVIMPFSETPTRNESDLSEFFNTNLKKRIESEQSLKYQYSVKRSDDSFDINAQIIRDLYNADIVLCDLSGNRSNPNVMYELGMRLAITNKPVVLFREKHPDNRRIFDISGFHAHEYNITKYRELEDYVINKLIKFESGEEVFESPVLSILKTDPTVLKEVNRKRSRKLLNSLRLEIIALQRSIGGALFAFLQENKMEPKFSTPEATLSFFQDNREMLSKLDWSTFEFMPSIVPALNAFLVEFPLDNLIDADLERLVNTFVHEFYNHYLATNHGWLDASYGNIYSFLGEGYNLRQILAGGIFLLGDPPATEKNEVVNQMRGYIKNSVFHILKEENE